MPSVGPMEIILIVTAALLVFGPKKLPELGRSLGQGLREFRTSTRELKGDLDLGPGSTELKEEG